MATFKLPSLVVIEGVDGVGKTTLAEKFEKELGYRYLYPVPTPFKSIRKRIEKLGDIEVRFWYYLASNVTLQQVLRRMIASGKRVVLDRYVYSTMASHQAMGATVECVELSKVPHIIPDYAVLLTCSPQVRNARILSRGLEKEEYLQHESPILDETERLLREYPLHVIDTTNLTEEQVFATTKDLLFETTKKDKYAETVRGTRRSRSVR